MLLAVVLPRMRARRAEAQRERELERRRDQEVERHRGEAEVRGLRAEEAEQRATIAAKEAEVERAQAEAHEARASLHERGLADDELMGERDTARTDERIGEREPGRFGRDGRRPPRPTARRDRVLDDARFRVRAGPP